MHKRSGTWDFVIIGASTALRARGSALVRRYAHLGRRRTSLRAFFPLEEKVGRPYGTNT
jgi:hypothetical protein